MPLKIYRGGPLSRYQLSLMTDCRRADGTVLTAGDSAGHLKIFPGGWGSGTVVLRGEWASNNTKTGTVCFEWFLPTEYLTGQDVKINVQAAYAGGGTPGTVTIDAEIYKLSDAGAATVIRASSTQNLTSSYADYVFTANASTLVAGDHLLALVRMIIQETAGGVVGARIGSIEAQPDRRF